MKSEKKIKCKLCSYKSVYISNVNSHFKRVHLEEKNFKCGKCDYRVYEKSKIQRHSLIHLSDGDKEKIGLKCPYSGCAFQSIHRGNLAKHSKLHVASLKKNTTNNCSVSERAISIAGIQTLDFWLTNGKLKCEYGSRSPSSSSDKEQNGDTGCDSFLLRSVDCPSEKLTPPFSDDENGNSEDRGSKSEPKFVLRSQIQPFLLQNQ